MKYRDLVKLVERHGWRYVRTTGSHMIYDHPEKGRIVVIPSGGKLQRDVPHGTFQSILKQAGLKRES